MYLFDSLIPLLFCVRIQKGYWGEVLLFKKSAWHNLLQSCSPNKNAMWLPEQPQTKPVT